MLQGPHPESCLRHKLFLTVRDAKTHHSIRQCLRGAPKILDWKTQTFVLQCRENQDFQIEIHGNHLSGVLIWTIIKTPFEPKINKVDQDTFLHINTASTYDSTHAKELRVLSKFRAETELSAICDCCAPRV